MVVVAQHLNILEITELYTVQWPFYVNVNFISDFSNYFLKCEWR